MVKVVRVQESKNGRRAHLRHLYSVPSERGAIETAFEKEYGAKKGKRVYGATVGRVRAEQRIRRRRFETRLEAEEARRDLPKNVRSHYTPEKIGWLPSSGYRLVPKSAQGR